MRDDAEMQKNVAFACAAIHLPINVLPVPGGPKRSSPFGGSRTPGYRLGITSYTHYNTIEYNIDVPLKMSGLSRGQTTISVTVCFANSSPAMSSQVICGRMVITSFLIISTSFGSMCFNGPTRRSGSGEGLEGRKDETEKKNIYIYAEQIDIL